MGKISERFAFALLFLFLCSIDIVVVVVFSLVQLCCVHSDCVLVCDLQSISLVGTAPIRDTPMRSIGSDFYTYSILWLTMTMKWLRPSRLCEKCLHG